MLITTEIRQRLDRLAQSFTGTCPPAAYCTLDEVNLGVMGEVAGLLRLPVEHHEPRDGEVTGPVVVIDADSWWAGALGPAAGVEALLGQLVRPAVLAVHGWCLTDDQARRLRAAGCVVSHRLSEAFVAAIARAAHRLPPAPLV